MKFVCTLLGILFYTILQAQSTYEVMYLGNYDDSVSLDPSLNWYVSHTDETNHTQQFVPINIQTDLVQTYTDSLYKLSLDSSFIKQGWILIGTTDTINTFVRKSFIHEPGIEQEPYMLPLGYSFSMYQQGFREVSPYITFYVTGKMIPGDVYPRMKQFKLQVNCFFDPFAYHQTFGTEHCKSFTQSLNKPIEDFLKSQGRNTDITFSRHLIFKGYIDNDCYRDCIVQINGYHFLFLTSGYNFKKKQMMHLEKAWKDKRHFFEF